MSEHLDGIMRYFPERYRRSRHFAKRVAARYQKIAGLGPPTHDLLQDVYRIVGDCYNEEIDKLPFELRPSNTRMVMREPNLALYYGMFTTFGRNLFDLLPGLVTEFRNTDVDDVPLSAVQFAFEAFYISFGPQDDLRLYGYSTVDGAYVFAFPGYPLQIVLTTLPDESKPEDSWVLNPARYYYLPLSTDDKDASFGVLIKDAIEKEISEQEDKGNIPDTGVYQVDGREIGIVNKRPETSLQDQKEVLDGEVVFREALRLVVNTICYLSQYPEEIDDSWPDGTPPALLEKLTKPKTRKQAQKAQAQLLAMGYSKIKICGRSIGGHDTDDMGGDVRPHWRRGHWRNQPYGELAQKRRLIWIRPTIVRRDKGDPEHGHIYEV